MNQQQYTERELQPFDWDSYLDNSQVSNNDWEDDFHHSFALLTLEELESESPHMTIDELDTDSVPSLVSDRSSDSDSDSTRSTVRDIMMYTIDKPTKEIPKEEHECPICFEAIPYEKKIKTNCNHVFCSQCMLTYLDHCNHGNKSPCCAMCRANYNLFEIPHPETFEKVKTHVDSYETDDDFEIPENVTTRSHINRQIRQIWAFSQPLVVDDNEDVLLD